MSGYTTYCQWKRIEDFADKLGFRIGNPKSGAWGRDSDNQYDVVAIFPKDDALPIYNREAELFCGTFAQLNIFLMGWEKAQSYDAFLRMTDDKKRKKYEDKERERQRIERERLEKRKMFAALSDKTEAQVDRLVK